MRVFERVVAFIDDASGVSRSRRLQGKAHVESLGGSGIGNDPRLYHRAGRCRGSGGGGFQ